jgi:hypothetical protein
MWQADGERQPHQREDVQSEAETAHHNERADYRDRQRQAGDDRGSPTVQKEEDDQDGEQATDDQRALHVLNRIAYENRAVHHRSQADVPRQFLIQIGQHARHAVGHFHRVCAGLLDDVQGQAGPAVDQRSAAALFDAIHHARDFRQENRPPIPHGHNQVSESVDGTEFAGDTHERFLVALIELAGRQIDILAPERAGDLGIGQVKGAQFLAVDQNLNLAARQANQIHLPDAGDRLQPFLDDFLRQRR